MSESGSGPVRGMAYDAWRDVRRRPAAWLILAASCIPIIFLSTVMIPELATIPGFSQALYFLLIIAGYAVCYAILFFFWCAAVFGYDDLVAGGGELSYGGAYRLTAGRALPVLRAGLAYGLASVLVVIFAQPVVGLIVSLLASVTGAGEGNEASLRILGYVSFYLGYIVADLAMVFIVMLPQMLALEGGRKLDEILRASYMVVRERYKDALLLLLVPELIARTLTLGLSAATALLGESPVIFPSFLLLFAAVEGWRTAFVAASFNRFYYRVLEEEKRKRKAKGKQAEKKPPVGKQAGKKRPDGKRAPAKRPAAGPSRKK